MVRTTHKVALPGGVALLTTMLACGGDIAIRDFRFGSN